MSNQIITSDLIVELSTDEQQLLAGGLRLKKNGEDNGEDNGEENGKEGTITLPDGTIIVLPEDI